MREITINNAKIQEILHWIQEKVDNDTIYYNFEIDKSELTEKDIIDYLVNIIESNLYYDFGFEYGLD